MSLDTQQSVFREKLIEHLFIGEMLKLSWLKHGATLEVSHPAIDRSGHDIVLEVGRIVRHIQLKTSASTARTAKQNIHVALQSKPSGCVVWTRFDPETMALGPFLFFGGAPGTPLATLEQFPTARHTKGDATGTKAERPNLRVVPRRKFESIDSAEALYERLFGCSVTTGATTNDARS